MVKLNIVLPLLMAVGLFVASPAFAAQNQTNNSNQPSAQMSLTPSSINFSDFHVKDLIGKDIRNHGKFIGKVSDVIIGKDGKVDFVVLSTGGLLSSKYTPVPYKMFISNASNLNNLRKSRSVNTMLSKAEIDKAPAFKSRHFNMNNSRARVCGYFGPQQCS